MKKDVEDLIKDEIHHPEYPVDMIDKLWDDYHEARVAPSNVIEYKDGETREGKICLKAEDYRALQDENERLRADAMDLRRKLEERDNLIWELRAKLENERKSSKWAQSDKANKLTKKNELEDLFLDCVEEVRKDIARRRAMSATYSNKKLNMRKSMSTRSLAEATSEPEAARIGQYTATDKRKVIELLMSNENVLLFLYEKLFPAVST